MVLDTISTSPALAPGGNESPLTSHVCAPADSKDPMRVQFFLLLAVAAAQSEVEEAPSAPAPKAQEGKPILTTDLFHRTAELFYDVYDSVHGKFLKPHIDKHADTVTKSVASLTEVDVVGEACKVLTCDAKEVNEQVRTLSSTAQGHAQTAFGAVSAHALAILAQVEDGARTVQKTRRRSPRRATVPMAVRRPGIMLWALLGLLALLRPSLSFLAPLGRRAALSAALAPLGLASAAMAEEAPKKKKERPPEALMAEGYPSKGIPLNGRWSIVFGKKLNDKPVYKKDGEKMFLMSNECGQFQIDSVAKSSCDGFGVKKDWASGSSVNSVQLEKSKSNGHRHATRDLDRFGNPAYTYHFF
eukprot:s1717_g6.t1